MELLHSCYEIASQMFSEHFVSHSFGLILMICNSTNAVVTSGSVHFLFSNNGFILFIMELSNQDEKQIWDLFS